MAKGRGSCCHGRESKFLRHTKRLPVRGAGTAQAVTEGLKQTKNCKLLYNPSVSLRSPPPLSGQADYNSNQKLSPQAGKVSRRSRDERGKAQSCQVPRDVPPQSAYADSSPARGGAFWRSANSYVKPALKGEVDMSVSEWTEGLHRGFACLRQPLSQSALRRIASSPAGEPFGVLYKLKR